MNEHVEPQDLELLWKECLKILESSLEKPTFETCLKDTVALSFEKNLLTLGVSSFAKSYLKKKNDLREKISETIMTLRDMQGRKCSLHLVEMDNGRADEKEPREETSSEEITVKEKEEESGRKFTLPGHDPFRINSNYTFDTFVIGNSNSFASAACRAVSESPGVTYNPLFIYGGVGLGKTHLLQAIGNRVLSQNRKMRVVYVSTEKFTAELIKSLQEGKMIQFREHYRNVDVLLIDDIQFLINKERTQEEFFFTFSELHGAGKQIVISSDRPPIEIPTLSDRLRSRFAWGLVADIQPPDIETREAILHKKAKAMKMQIPIEVISFIAQKIPSNIRELEGALVTVSAFASIHRKEVSEELAKEALKNIIPVGRDRTVTPEMIQTRSAEYFGIKRADIISDKRDQIFSYTRHIAMFLTRELTNMSLPDIARAFNRTDHTTVLHACKKVNKLLEGPKTRNEVENIKNLLKE
jgi:chromosomal replication initiator protein